MPYYSSDTPRFGKPFCLAILGRLQDGWFTSTLVSLDDLWCHICLLQLELNLRDLTGEKQ